MRIHACLASKVGVLQVGERETRSLLEAEAWDTNFLRDGQWIQTFSLLSIVAPAFSLHQFDNNVASVIGRRGKERSDWLAGFFNCVHLRSFFRYQVCRIVRESRIASIDTHVLYRWVFLFYKASLILQGDVAGQILEPSSLNSLIYIHSSLIAYIFFTFKKLKVACV